MAVRWYELDTGAIAAVFLGRGIFVLPNGGDTWMWYPSGTDGWDAFDQRIHRQGHAYALDEPPPEAPPLPDPGPPAPLVDRDHLGALAQDPALVAWVDVGRTVFVALFEDDYESKQGDGVFRYVVGAFGTEEEARLAEVPVGMDRHVRRVDLWVEDGAVHAKAERVDFADRFLLADALSDLAARLHAAR